MIMKLRRRQYSYTIARLNRSFYANTVVLERIRSMKPTKQEDKKEEDKQNEEKAEDDAGQVESKTEKTQNDADKKEKTEDSSDIKQEDDKQEKEKTEDKTDSEAGDDKEKEEKKDKKSDDKQKPPLLYVSNILQLREHEILYPVFDKERMAIVVSAVNGHEFGHLIVGNGNIDFLVIAHLKNARTMNEARTRYIDLQRINMKEILEGYLYDVLNLVGYGIGVPPDEGCEDVLKLLAAFSPFCKKFKIDFNGIPEKQMKILKSFMSCIMDMNFRDIKIDKPMRRTHLLVLISLDQYGQTTQPKHKQRRYSDIEDDTYDPQKGHDFYYFIKAYDVSKYDIDEDSVPEPKDILDARSELLFAYLLLFMAMDINEYVVSPNDVVMFEEVFTYLSDTVFTDDCEMNRKLKNAMVSTLRTEEEEDEDT